MSFVPSYCRARVEAIRERLSIETGAPVSESGARCAAFVEDLFEGFFHLPADLKNARIDWSGERVRVPLWLGADLATHDYGLLTRAVLLAHKHVIRLSVDVTTEPLRPALVLVPTVPGIGEGQHPTLGMLMAMVEQELAVTG